MARTCTFWFNESWSCLTTSRGQPCNLKTNLDLFQTLTVLKGKKHLLCTQVNALPLHIGTNIPSIYTAMFSHLLHYASMDDIFKLKPLLCQSALLHADQFVNFADVLLSLFPQHHQLWTSNSGNAFKSNHGMWTLGSPKDLWLWSSFQVYRFFAAGILCYFDRFHIWTNTSSATNVDSF